MRGALGRRAVGHIRAYSRAQLSSARWSRDIQYTTLRGCSEHE